MAGADLLVADYQATGDRSSMTTLRTFTATSMARLHALQPTLPAGSLDDLLQAAQALDQVEQVSVHACSSCDGPLIGSVPPVLTQSLQSTVDPWQVGTPPRRATAGTTPPTVASTCRTSVATCRRRA